MVFNMIFTFVTGWLRYVKIKDVLLMSKRLLSLTLIHSISPLMQPLCLATCLTTSTASEYRTTPASSYSSSPSSPPSTSPAVPICRPPHKYLAGISEVVILKVTCVAFVFTLVCVILTISWVYRDIRACFCALCLKSHITSLIPDIKHKYSHIGCLLRALTSVLFYYNYNYKQQLLLQLLTKLTTPTVLSPPHAPAAHLHVSMSAALACLQVKT